MHASALLLTGLAAAAAAHNGPAGPIVTPGAQLPGALVQALAHPEQPVPRELVQRDSQTCTSKILQIANASPTPTGALSRWGYTVPGGVVTITAFDDSLTTLCDVTGVTPPPSLSSAFSEYESSVSEWFESAKPAAQTLQKECGKEVSALAGLLLYTDKPGCTAAVQEFVKVAGAPSSRAGVAGVAAAAAVAVAGVMAVM